MKSNTTFFFRRDDEKDFFIPFHIHKCYEMVYYISGCGYCYIDGKRYEYDKNTVVIIPPEAKHNDVHTENCTLICIGFTIDQGAVFNAKKPEFFKASDIVATYLNVIAKEFNEKKPSFLSVVGNLFDNVLIELERSVAITTQDNPQKGALQQAINFINEYFLTEITPNQLADLTNYSYHRFRHIFKSVTGISPKQYILSKRLEYAKSLLSQTNDSVTEIAYQCHFSTTSLFIKQFKSANNITPKQYRALLYSEKNFSKEQSIYDK